MSDSRLDHSALQQCLDTLNHLFIDIVRLTYEQGYEEIVGGYCELKVATLDSGKSTSKLVAAKKLRFGVRALEPNRLAFRLARELKVWAGLRHPHVLPLLGFPLGDDYKTALLISEYMKHGDLKDFIAKAKPSRNERLSLVRDLTDGLAYLHTQNAPIRHGDLKPGNVLVNSDRRALLADFGLSKTLDTGPTGFTTGNDARYTIRYSSPEVLLEGRAAESLPNDIWSWGCLVVEALTDEIPFANIKLDAQLMLAIVQGTFPSDVPNLSSCTQEFKVLLANCWSRQPSQRPTAVDCLRIVGSAIPSQPSGPQLPATVAGLNVSPEQLAKAQEKIRATIGLFYNKRDYSSINLPHHHGILLEQSIQQTHSLLKQVAQNLVAFVVLAPNDERELNQVAHTVVTLSDQAQILQKQPPEKRFIFGLGDLNQYRNHLTTFLMRVKGLKSQAMAMQIQQGSGALPPGPPPPPVVQQEPAAPPQPPVQVPIRPPTAELPRQPIPAPPMAQPQQPQQPSVAGYQKPGLAPQAPKQPIRKPMPPPSGPAVSSPSPAASTPVNQPQTPAPNDSPNTPKSPAINSKVAPGKKPVSKPKIPPKRGTTKRTPKLPPAEVPGISRPETERPQSQSTKREREDDVTGPDGSAGPSGSTKRVRTDPQEDLDVKRAADLAAAKQFTVEGSLDFLEKTTKEYEKVINDAAATAENGATEQNSAANPTLESLLQMLDQGALYDFAADLPSAIPGLAPALGVKPEEGDTDWLWALDSIRWATEDPAVVETPELVQSVSSQGPTPNSDGEPDTHTASVGVTASAPIVPKVEASGTAGHEFWASIGAPEGRYYSDDTEWKWDGKMETNGDWPISYPAA